MVADVSDITEAAVTTGKKSNKKSVKAEVKEDEVQEDDEEEESPKSKSKKSHAGNLVVGDSEQIAREDDTR